MTTLAPVLRQRWRRDAVQLTVWIAGLAALAAAGYPGVRGSYGDEQERLALLATVMANPVVLLFRGLPSGSGEAQLVAFLLLPWLLLVVALMCSFLAVRHSRGDEEDGRLELVAATPAGRTIPLVATVVHGAGAALIAGIVVAVIFVASGAPAAGSALIGAACVLIGLVFLGVGLAAAELMPTSHATNALAVWIVLATFTAAGVGNALGTADAGMTRMTSSPLTWTSPFGWAENIRPFDADNPAPLIVTLILAVGVLGLSALLHARRDLGASFVPQRRGRAHARRSFRSHLALVVRQSRPAVIGWMVAGLLVGILSTALATVASRLGDDNPAVTALLDALGGADDLARGLIVAFFVMIGVFAACAATQTVIRARQDETHGTAELVLSTAVDRRRWLADHFIVAAIAATLTLAAGVAGAIWGSLGRDDGSTLMRDAVIAGAGQLLPAWLFASLAAVLVVALPRLTAPLGWALIAASAAIALFGPVVGLDASIADLSPFAAAPIPSADAVDLRGVVPLVLVTVIATGGALLGMRRRELVA